jgi:hypothetical protein
MEQKRPEVAMLIVELEHPHKNLATMPHICDAQMVCQLLKRLHVLRLASRR